jgi:hypothetical protein
MRNKARRFFFEAARVDERDMMGFMIAAIKYDQFGHPGWIVGNPDTGSKRQYSIGSAPAGEPAHFA